MAAGFEIFGANDLSSKLVTALAGFGIIVITYFTGKKIQDHKFGFVAAFIMLTTQYFIDRTRQGLLDIPMTFFMLLAFFFIVMSIKRELFYWPVLAGLATALAFLSKGIPAVGMIAVAGITFLIYRKSLKSTLVKFGLYLAGISIILGPWSYLQFELDAGNFFNWYFFKQVRWIYLLMFSS